MGGKCVVQCEGCDHNKEGVCKIFISPEAKFRVGRGISCGSATHIGVRLVMENEKVRVGQQKQKSVKVYI